MELNNKNNNIENGNNIISEVNKVIEEQFHNEKYKKSQNVQIFY